jgi:phosphatidylserine decarboxylase
MRVHKEGYKIILVVFIVLVLAIAIMDWFLPHQTKFHYFLYFALFLFFIFIVRFFRNPNRPVLDNGNVILAPADGKIVVIDEVEEKEYFKDKRLQVSVFMSPMNVHKNWYPIKGTVKFYKYHPGKFLVAWHPKSSDLNERTSVVVESPQNQTILIRQIAGAVAQRIVCYAKVNAVVNQGEELGFIKFGSRVDLFLPLGTKIDVVKNQKVTGNVSVIGRF